VKTYPYIAATSVELKRKCLGRSANGGIHQVEQIALGIVELGVNGTRAAVESIASTCGKYSMLREVQADDLGSSDDLQSKKHDDEHESQQVKPTSHRRGKDLQDCKSWTGGSFSTETS
jgi:hypothetical protein